MQPYQTLSLVMWSYITYTWTTVLILPIYKNNHRCEWWCSWGACTQGANINSCSHQIPLFNLIDGELQASDLFFWKSGSFPLNRILTVLHMADVLFYKKTSVMYITWAQEFDHAGLRHLVLWSHMVICSGASWKAEVESSWLLSVLWTLGPVAMVEVESMLSYASDVHCWKERTS